MMSSGLPMSIIAACFVWVLNQCKNDTHIEDNVLDGMTSGFLAGCFGQIRWIVSCGFGISCCLFVGQKVRKVFLGLCQPKLRDYSQDLDAILLAKSAKLTPEMTSMWQDHVGRHLINPSGKAQTSEDTSAAVDEAEDNSFKKLRLLVCFESWKRPVVVIGVCKFYTLKENLRVAEYGVVIANVSHDYREAVSYNLRRHKAWIEQKMFLFQWKLLFY